MADHRIERAFERYGLVLTADDLAAIDRLPQPCNLIRTGSDGAAIHGVLYRGTTMLVAVRTFETGKRGSVTFLPPDCLFVRVRNAYRAKKRGKQSCSAYGRREGDAPVSRSRRRSIAWQELDAE
jgi:hypothetical protein